VVLVVLMTWVRGTGRLLEKSRKSEMPLDFHAEQMAAKPPHLVPGHAIGRTKSVGPPRKFFTTATGRVTAFRTPPLGSAQDGADSCRKPQDNQRASRDAGKNQKLTSTIKKITYPHSIFACLTFVYLRDRSALDEPLPSKIETNVRSALARR
jgi:hypothetical protein